MDSNEIYLNRMANMTAMLLLLCDNIKFLSTNKVFEKVTAEKVAIDKVVANLAIVYSSADASLSSFAKKVRRREGEGAMWQSFEEIQHLSTIMERFFEALSDIDPKHHEAISVDFANVIKHYKVRPNKLIVADRIREAYQLALKTHPTTSYHSFMLGYLAEIEDMSKPNK